MPELPEDITDVDKIDPIQGDSKLENTPNPDTFKQHMAQNEPQNTGQKNAPSPMQAVNAQKINASTPPTPDKIQSQMESVSGTLGDIKNKLHTKGLKLKSSDKYLVRQKLTRANDHMKHAAKKLGVDNDEESYDEKLYKSKNPIAKFLSMVSDGQHQMVEAAQQIKHLNSSGKSINPGELLLVQIKLNKAQQELNYTSVILGNATSMLKTLMNTQI